jgi:hypothetical protein
LRSGSQRLVSRSEVPALRGSSEARAAIIPLETAGDAPPRQPAGVVVADGLDEHVPLVDELEHGKDAQPDDPEQRHR